MADDAFDAFSHAVAGGSASVAAVPTKKVTAEGTQSNAKRPQKLNVANEPNNFLVTPPSSPQLAASGPTAQSQRPEPMALDTSADTPKKKGEADLDNEAEGSLAVIVARKVLRDEGIQGFYTGLASGLVGMGSSWFTYYFWFNYLTTLAKQKSGARVLSNLKTLLIAAQSGTITCVLMEPIWVVNTRAKLAKGKMGNVFGEMFKIWREEGLSPLFGGILPSLLLVSNPSIQFMVAEYIKTMVEGKIKMMPWHHFLNGAVSKLVATIVLKTRLQRKENKDNILMCIYRVYEEEGWEGFYRGMEMKISQTVLTSAFMFFFYSLLHGGVKRTLEPGRSWVVKFVAIIVSSFQQSKQASA